MRRICADFPGSYWRELDEREGYPSEFVKAMTQAGFLSALIPEVYGGSGLPLRAAGVILEEIHACGGNASATHAQMYTMGTVLRHGSEAQKNEYLPQIASGQFEEALMTLENVLENVTESEFKDFEFIIDIERKIALTLRKLDREDEAIEIQRRLDAVVEVIDED